VSGVSVACLEEVNDKLPTCYEDVGNEETAPVKFSLFRVKRHLTANLRHE